MRLKDKRVIITAAGSGIGRAAAEMFAREGARVAVVDISADRAGETVERIAAAGGQGKAIVADLSDSQQCRTLVGESVDWLGGLDVLWNHAGIPGTDAVEDISDEDYDLAMNINVRSAYIISGQAAGPLRAAGGGAILVTSSTSGLVGAPTSALYAVGKFGVIGLTMSLALRFARDNIRVNAICPGPIQTGMSHQFLRSDDPAVVAQKEQNIAASVPMGRRGQPEEVAAAGLFLASDEASYITGVALPVDGGYLAR